jgi:hypothetical protein
MKRILNHVNQKLREHKIELDVPAVEAELIQVTQRWEEVMASITKPIKYLIIGEATVSWANYFYNEDSKSTSFLSPTHFGVKGKKALIDFFNKNGVLVFDLYPLPLPSFIYDKIHFDCGDSLYKKALIDHYKIILKLIDDQTVIVLRYKSLEQRCEWKVFIEEILDEIPKINKFNIGISRAASEELINEVFMDILPKVKEEKDKM